MYRLCFKRLFDILVASIGIIATSPILLLTALAIKLDSKGPILFKQNRIGFHGYVFSIYKFRSMKINSEHTGSGVYSEKSDPRVTRVGAFLRATSIDELPQFFNILVGDMSLIGPRPPLTYHPWPYLEYTDEQRKMFNVRPGVTGWAQINGRKTVEWNQRIKFSVWYVENYSFKLDMRILFNTVIKVLRNEDNLNAGETLKK